MKILMVFPILTVLFSTRGQPLIINTKADLESFSLTPLYLGETSTFSFSIKAATGSTLALKVNLYNEYYPSGVSLLSKTFNKIQTYKLSYDNKYTGMNNEIEIAYTPLNKTTSYIRKALPLCVPDYEYIDNKDQITSKSKMYTYLPLLGWSESTVTYTFYNFNSIYVPLYYHKLDFSDLKIKMPANAYNAFDCNAFIFIENYSAPFYESEGNAISIELKPIKGANNTVYFEPKNNLYVEKDSLNMSRESRPGYVKTRHFYLPRNQMKNQTNYSFTIFMTSFGVDKSVVSSSFKFNAVTNTVGDCINSEYCVVKE